MMLQVEKAYSLKLPVFLLLVSPFFSARFLLSGVFLLAILSNIFVGLYGSIIVYQERSFKSGVAYVVAIVAEFDEYSNDRLYLREGSLLPKPKYHKRSRSHSSESSIGASTRRGVKNGSVRQDAPAMFVPSFASSRSVRETIQEVKMVQIWEEWMKFIELRGKELLDANIVTEVELTEWLRTKEAKQVLALKSTT